MKFKFLLFLIMSFLASCSLFNEEGKILHTAKYSIIEKQLKNPSSMNPENFKVVDKFKYHLPDDSTDYTLWFVHGDVTASNSFGGNIQKGYCVVFFTLNNGDNFGTNYVLQECTRGSPTTDEINSVKALYGWDKYKTTEIK